MARPRKPTALKAVQGTARPDRQVAQEPEFEQKGYYDPPENLDGLALRTWNSVMPILVEAGVLTVADLRTLEAYCVHYSNFKKAQQEVDEVGYTVVSAQGSISKNPSCTVVEKASSEMRALAGVLGLDPSSRTRINVGKKESPKKSFGALRKPSARK